MIRGMALCTGVGGLELGIGLALGPGYRCVCYVEREAFVAGVLAARMQDGDLAEAPIWDDLRTFDGRPWRGRVDLVSAGFPCQPFSQAGKGESTSDPRYLWDDVSRVIGEVEPSIVFLENVQRLLTTPFVLGDDSTRGEVFGQVLADLAALGYVGAWRTLRAADVGAPHRRDRVFILAVSDPGGGDQVVADADGTRRKGAERAESSSDGIGVAEQRERGSRPTRCSDALADPDGRGCEGERRGGVLDRQRSALGDDADGRDLWGRSGPWSVWAAEPHVGRVVDGVAAGLDMARSSRRGRLRATGNGCVPQQAAAAFDTLMAAILKYKPSARV